MDAKTFLTSQQKSSIKQSNVSVNNNSSLRPKTPTSPSSKSQVGSGAKSSPTKPSWVATKPMVSTSTKPPVAVNKPSVTSSPARSSLISPPTKTSLTGSQGRSSNVAGGSGNKNIAPSPARTSFTSSLGKSSPSKSAGKSSANQPANFSAKTPSSPVPKTPVSSSPKLPVNASSSSSKPQVVQPNQSNQAQNASQQNSPETSQPALPANPPQPQPNQNQITITVTSTANANNTSSPAAVNKSGGNVTAVVPQKPPQQQVTAFKNVSGGAFPNIDPSSFPRPMNLPFGPGPRASISKSMTVGMDRSRNLRAFVEKAMAEHKVFTCVGVYPAVKNAMKKRGWVEKQGPLNMVRSANNGMMNGSEDESDAAWVARNLRDYPPDFIWVIRRDNIDWKSLHKDQVINRYPRAWFTTKVGIVACLQQLHWFSEPGVADTFFPRCYRLCLEDERQAFQDDYRMTACMSLLRWFVEQYETKGSMSLVDGTSKITSLSIDFATRQLSNYIKIRRHEDIDWHLSPSFMPQHWEAFLTQYYNVVHDKKRIRFDTEDAVKGKYDMAKRTLGRIGQYWPQAHFDGIYNMWICKPGARSRGKGIVIMNTMEKIMDLLSQNNYRESNWVVQKYMERPLLVYKTKFDIRQWFIITDWTPLTLWFYKESYVRFCTKPFVLEDFHESIHLCNNAIQCRYQNSELRDSALPDENMWDCYTFQAYLKTIGKLDEWPKIYEGMKQAIIGVLLASQENVDARRGCFELYGADFMLAEDFKPWLIEINSCPCMAGSTSVTARMCVQCLEDTIKVVIDRKANKNADTGMFEMVFKQNPSAVAVQQFTGHDLVVQGKKLTRELDWPGVMVAKSAMSRSNAPLGPPTVGTTNGPPRTGITTAPPAESLTFADLLQRLRMKNVAILQGKQNNPKDVQDDNTRREQVTSNVTSNPNSTVIAGMKKVYPVPSTKTGSGTLSKHKQPATNSSSLEKSRLGGRSDRNANDDPSFAYISKYAADGIDLSNIIRLKQSLHKENDENRPRSNINRRAESPTNYGNPYLPSGNIRTMDDMKANLNQKYCKSESNSPCESLHDLILPDKINRTPPSSSFSTRPTSATLIPGTEGPEEHAEQSKHSETEIQLEEKSSAPLIDLSSPPSNSTPELPALTIGNNDDISDILNNNYVTEALFKFPPIVNTSSESNSESNSDSGMDFLTNMITPYPSPFHRASEERARHFQGATVTKRKTCVRSLSHHRTHSHHRHSHPNLPCHRVSLQAPQKGSGKMSAPTLPLKKINLKLS